MYRKYIATIVILKITFRIFYFDNIQVTNSLLFFHGYQNNLLDITARNSLSVTASSIKKPRHTLSSKIVLFSRDLYSTDSSRGMKKKKKRWTSKPCRVTHGSQRRVDFYWHNLIKGQTEFLTPQFGLITNVNRLSLSPSRSV